MMGRSPAVYGLGFLLLIISSLGSGEVLAGPNEGPRLARGSEAQISEPENAAHEAYLKGRYYWNQRTLEAFNKSIEYFEQAIEKDPCYALAYAGVADTYILLGEYGLISMRETYPKAKAAALRALAIDERLAEAHNSLAFIRWYYEFDWLAAEREYKRAIELNPNYSVAHHQYGEYLGTMGRFEEAAVELKRAQELEPTALAMKAVEGWIYLFDRKYNKAIEQLQKAIAVDPDFPLPHFYLGRAYLITGKFEEGIAELEKLAVIYKRNAFTLAALGYAYAVAGRTDDARELLAELKERAKQKYTSPYWVVFAYVGLGEKDEAFEWLEKSYEDHWGHLAILKVNPFFDSLRSDPRFADLLRRVGIPKDEHVVPNVRKGSIAGGEWASYGPAPAWSCAAAE